MTTSGSPYRSVQGVGKHLRPSATDLGKGKTTSSEEKIIRQLMQPQAKKVSPRNKKTNLVNMA